MSCELTASRSVPCLGDAGWSIAAESSSQGRSPLWVPASWDGCQPLLWLSHWPRWQVRAATRGPCHALRAMISHASLPPHVGHRNSSKSCAEAQIIAGIARTPHRCMERRYWMEINAACTGGGVRVSKGTPQDAPTSVSVLPGAHQAVWCLHASGGRICVVR